MVNTVILQHPSPEVKHWLIGGWNDDASLGAVRSTEENKLNVADVCAVGIDGTECVDELKKPTPTAFYGSILLNAKQHGYASADNMYNWIKDGTTPPKLITTVGTLITRDNFMAVRKANDFADNP